MRRRISDYKTNNKTINFFSCYTPSCPPKISTICNVDKLKILDLMVDFEVNEIRVKSEDQYTHEHFTILYRDNIYELAMNMFYISDFANNNIPISDLKGNIITL